MFQRIKNWWKEKNKAPLRYINEFCLIKVSDIARNKGIEDDENKIIEHYKSGRLFKTYVYSEALVQSLKEVYEIPVISEDFEDEEEYEWEEPTEFGVTKLRI